MNKTCPDCGGNCGRYLRFAKQTPETIAMVNEWLEGFIMKHGEEDQEDFESWLNK